MSIFKARFRVVTFSFLRYFVMRPTSATLNVRLSLHWQIHHCRVAW